MNAYLFPGQGSQFKGMGLELYQNFPKAKELFEAANTLLGYRLSDVMFFGTEEELQNTLYTQPATFLYSYIDCVCNGTFNELQAVAGHSLGEFTALTVAQCLTFEEGLMLVDARAKAMKKACEKEATGLMAVVGLEFSTLETLLYGHQLEVYCSNYNTPTQIVLGGRITDLEQHQALFKSAGAKLVKLLKVDGAFHTPFMEDAQHDLQTAIEQLDFKAPIYDLYQNYTGLKEHNPQVIQHSLIEQLQATVLWSPTIQAMAQSGITHFKAFGSGQALEKMIPQILKF